MKKFLIQNSYRTAAVGLAVLAAAGLSGCGTGSAPVEVQAAQETPGSEGKESDGVKKVTVAFDQAYPPYDFVDDAGNADGYEIAVLRAIDERLPQYEFAYVPTTNDDLLIGVESGKYDLGVKGVWWTKEREENYIFPEHYIGSSEIGIAFRTEDADSIKDLESFADFSGNLVPIAPQNAQYVIVENYNKAHPDKQVTLTPADQFTLADAYQWVLEGRYDAYVTIRTSFEANIVSESGEYHQFADQLTYASYEAIPTWALFNKNDQELADAYDSVWEQLQSEGVLEELSQKYFGYSLFDRIPEGYVKGDDL